MDESTICQLANKQHLYQVRELEIIFTHRNGIDCLDKLAGLERLALIDNSLTRMPDLICVGGTLLSLTITKQSIDKMEFLSHLPNLRELFLQRNRIQKIENLSSCPCLQRLGLGDNRIERLEDLHNLGDLRELTIQGNKITQLTGLENNLCLVSLDLSRNPITKLKSLESLSHLSNLRELFIENEMFGSCPITLEEGYRGYAMCTLRQIKMLDGVNINDSDRSAEEDVFLQKTLEFNEKVDLLHRNHRNAIRNLDIEKENDMIHAQELTVQLCAQFSKLQEIITAGRKHVMSEQKNQIQLREKNAEYFRNQLIELKSKHRNILEELIEEEKRIIAEEEIFFADLTYRAQVELRESIAIAELSQNVAFQNLCDETTNGTISAELKTFVAKFTVPQIEEDILYIYRASKVYSAVKYQEHLTRCEALESEIDRDHIMTIDVYLATPSIEDLQRLFSIGTSKECNSKASMKQIVLCTNPQTAYALSQSTGDIKNMTRLVEGRLILGKVKQMSDIPKTCNALVQSAAGFLSDHSAVKFDFRQGESCFVVQDAHLFSPSMYLIAANPKQFVNANLEFGIMQQPSLDYLVQNATNKDIFPESGIPEDVEAKLVVIEKQISKCIQDYEERIRSELTPEEAEAIDMIERQTDTLETELGDTRKKIDQVKTKQEQMLREYNTSSYVVGSRR